MGVQPTKTSEEGKGDEPTSDGKRPADETDQNAAGRQGTQGAQIRYAMLFKRCRHRNHENSERQEQQAEQVHENGTVDAVRDDRRKKESRGDRSYPRPACSPPINQALLVIGSGTARADGGQRNRTRTHCVDPLQVEQQDEARDQDEAAAGTDQRAVDGYNARKDEQGGDG